MLVYEWLFNTIRDESTKFHSFGDDDAPPTVIFTTYGLFRLLFWSAGLHGIIVLMTIFNAAPLQCGALYWPCGSMEAKRTKFTVFPLWQSRS
jgi:hypothetical protein